MPKLQTACTTPAADGMVVDSLSARAREGQDAVLEFLLLNHPLDCPVCDKGGECPLQDLTFRYGPGSTRMRIPKRTLEKPVPISPLIKLDRERCILCYRCTRFSEGVSGDMQLVPENRGAHSIITTFEGRPYTNEFSGNVTELCPVGALTSTTYRFRARPWETQQIPSVCGLCAVGCNTAVNIREGHVVRVLSRNHPEIDEGWLCDKGRYAFGLLASEERITTGLIRGGRGLEQVAPGDALDHIADRLRATVERFGPGLRRRARLGRADQRGGARLGAAAGRGARRRDLGVRPRGRRGLGDARAVRRVDRRHRDGRGHRRRRRHRPRPPRPGGRAADPKGRPGRRARRDVGAGGTRLETLRGAHHVSAGPGHRPRRAPARRRGRRRARGRGRRRGDGRHLGRADAPRDRRGPGAPRPRPRVDGAAHAARRQRARLPGGRPRVGHARRRRSRRPTRAASRRSSCSAPIRWATGTTASAGAPPSAARSSRSR